MTNSPAVKEAAWPFGTFCLMAICMGVFTLISLGRFPTVVNYILTFGPDMQPGRWFTTLFIHANPVQLTICMIALLVLGSIVESRISLQWTIGLIVGLGAVGQAIAQMALLDAEQDGLSLGMGASICGLAGLLVVWSPMTKVDRLGKVGLGKVSIPIWAIVVACVIVDLGLYYFTPGLGPFSLFPQAISLAAGTLMGAVLLKSKIVEGDHQDLLTLIAGTAPGGRKERRKQLLQSRVQAEEAEQVQQQLTAAQEQLESYLGAGQLAASLALISKMSHVGEGLKISSAQLTTIIRGLHKQKKWEDSIPWLQQFLERFPEDVGMRLKLAQIFIVDQRLPGSGMEVLKPLADRKLSESEEKLYRQLERAQFNMWEDDDIQLEIEKRAW
jgi:membrane associated rhomboid family serine protease